MALKVIHYPHPTLRHVSRPLMRVDAELRAMIDEMFALMYEHEGIGLAANQVDLPYRLFVTNPTGDPDSPEAERVFLNPVIVRGAGSAEGSEGCLSLPGLYGPVVRKTSIRVQAYDLAGNEIDEELTGLAARVFQHETDHLDGTLFIDRVPPSHKASLRDELEEFEIDFASKQESGEAPSDAAIAERIAELQRLRT